MPQQPEDLNTSTKTTKIACNYLQFAVTIYTTVSCQLRGVTAEWLEFLTRVPKTRVRIPLKPVTVSHSYVTTLGKFFTPTVPGLAKGRFNQLTSGNIAGTSIT